MKKIRSLFVIVLSIMILISFSGCTNAKNTQNVMAGEDSTICYDDQEKDTDLMNDYDGVLLETAEIETTAFGFNFNSNPFSDGSRYFNVLKESEEKYSIDVNGDKLTVLISISDINLEYVPTNISDITAQYSNIINTSRNLVFQYIDSSKVLKDKEGIKNYIEILPIKEASFTKDSGVGAYFSFKDNCIYINKDNSEYICEWMIVHEMIHAISFYTHDCSIEKEEYAFSLFNEVLTDILVSTINPEIVNNSISGYSPYYCLIYPYIYTFGTESIYAYFYGYENIYNKVDKNEFEFFVTVIGNIQESNSNVYYTNLIYKWNK